MRDHESEAKVLSAVGGWRMAVVYGAVLLRNEAL